MTGVFIFLKKGGGGVWTQPHIQGEHHVKMKAETEVIHPQDKECQRCHQIIMELIMEDFITTVMFSKII